MKKQLLLLPLFLCCNLLLLAQTDSILFQENFNSSILNMNTSTTDSVNGTSFFLDSSISVGDTGACAAAIVDVSSNTYLTTPIIRLDSLVHPKRLLLNFDQLCYIDQFDDATIEYSFDGGRRWNRLPELFNENGFLYSVYLGSSTYGLLGNKFSKSSRPVSWKLLPVDDSAFVWTNSNANWINETFDLSPLVQFDSSASDSIQLRFALIDNPSSSPGRTGLHKWYVDNLSLYSPENYISLQAVTPNVGFKGDSLTVLIVGDNVDFGVINTPPSYTRGTEKIDTRIVEPRTRGKDTLEIVVHLLSTTKAGNYDLSLKTSIGTLFFRNALEVMGNNISGVIYHDTDTNGIQSTNEFAVNGVRVHLIDHLTKNKFGHSYSHLNGQFTMRDLDTGSYDVVIDPPAGMYTTAISDTIKITIDKIGAYTANFGILLDSATTSFNLYSGRARCSEFADYTLDVQNKSNQKISGVYHFVKNSFLTYDSLTMAMADSVNGDTIFYSFKGLHPFEWIRQTIYCEMPSVTVLPVGSKIQSKATLYLLDSSNTIIAGSDMEINSSTNVVCAYDPNDKQVSPIGEDSLGYIDTDSQLKYTIRFQNTGNDTAYRVVLIDTLSPSLDYSTFELLGSSHDVVNQLKSNGELTFTYDDIYLVDSATNEAASNGYVQFKINPVKNLVDSTTVTNKAAIYFDFNPPIITNTVYSTFREPIIVSIDEVEVGQNELKVFPNPTAESFTIQLPENENRLTVAIYDLVGKRIYYKEEVTPQNLKISLTNETDGFYFIRAQGAEKTYTSKIILSRK